MEIDLNSKTIIDELMALAALRGRRDSSAPVLTPDQYPALRNILRMGFAELCMRLGSIVEGSDMDFDDPAPDEPYAADQAQLRLWLALAMGPGAKGRELVVKRSLEHAVALLAASYALADEADGSAATFRAQAAGAVDALRDAATSAADALPDRLTPFFF